MARTRTVLALVLLLALFGCETNLERLDRLIDGGRYPEAEQRASARLADIEEEGRGDSLDAARILDRLVLASIRRGKLGADTLALAQRAVDIKQARQPDDPELSESLDQLGCLLGIAGDHRRATELYERSLSIRERAFGEDALEVSWTLNFYAPTLWDIGDYAAARLLYERALAIRRKHDSGIEGVLNNLGILAYDMGDYASARRHYTETLERRVAADPEHPLVAGTKVNLAIVHWRVGDLAEANRLATEALELQERVIPPGDQSIGITQFVLADIEVSAGQPRRARPRYERAIRILGQSMGQDHPFLVRPLLGYAAALRQTGDFDASRTQAQRALTISSSRLEAEHPYVSSSKTRVAAALLDAGDLRAGLRMALAAEAGSRRHLRLTSRSFAERQSLHYASVRASGLDLALSLAAAGLEPSELDDVFEAVIRSRALILDEMAARRRLLAEVSDPEIERLGIELTTVSTRLANLLVRGIDGDPEQHASLLTTTREEVEVAETRLAQHSAAFRRERELTAVGLDTVRLHLPSGAALVAVIRHQAHVPAALDEPVPRYLALVLRGNNAVAVPLAEAAVIDELVERWQEEAALRSAAAEQGLEEAERAYRRIGTALRETVWDPIARTLGRAELVFVVPDGALHTVSFSTLPTADGGYVVESGPSIHYLSAERDIVARFDGSARGEGLLAMGAPDFDTGRPGGTGTTRRSAGGVCPALDTIRFKALPQSEAEVGEIARRWSRNVGVEPDVFTGPSASEARFKREAPGKRTIHLATHGFFLGGGCRNAPAGTRSLALAGAGDMDSTLADPLALSGLAFAGANRRADARGNEEDGVLTAGEVTALDLRGVEWVVLSACDTGLGEIRDGEGVLGLRRAFQLAGARTLIMSLWSVDDTATRRFMDELYRARQRGATTVDSVRQASLSRLRARRDAAESTHPFFWGAFVAAGGWT